MPSRNNNFHDQIALILKPYLIKQLNHDPSIIAKLTYASLADGFQYLKDHHQYGPGLFLNEDQLNPLKNYIQVQLKHYLMELQIVINTDHLTSFQANVDRYSQAIGREFKDAFLYWHLKEKNIQHLIDSYRNLTINHLNHDQAFEKTISLCIQEFQKKLENDLN